MTLDVYAQLEQPVQRSNAPASTVSSAARNQLRGDTAQAPEAAQLVPNWYQA